MQIYIIIITYVEMRMLNNNKTTILFCAKSNKSMESVNRFYMLRVLRI